MNTQNQKFENTEENNFEVVPEPVFLELQVKDKKKKRPFRKFGDVTLYKKNGEVRIICKGGYERVNKPFFAKIKREPRHERKHK